MKLLSTRVRYSSDESGDLEVLSVLALWKRPIRKKSHRMMRVWTRKTTKTNRSEVKSTCRMIKIKTKLISMKVKKVCARKV